MGLITPNERQRLIQAERERRRIARLQQVRQLSRQAAESTRSNVNERKLGELTNIRNELVTELKRRTPSIVGSALRKLKIRDASSRSSKARRGLNNRHLQHESSHTHTPKARPRSLSHKRRKMTSADCNEAAKRGESALERLRLERSARKRAELEVRSRIQRAKERANKKSLAGAVGAQVR